jgi:hypothetical protein
MIPLSYLLFVYLVVVAIFGIFLIIHVYHLAVSASLTVTSFIVTSFVTVAGVLTIYGTWALLQSVDFSQPLIHLGNAISQNQF